MDDDFMTTVNMLTIASSLVAVLFSIIIALLAWIGNRTAETLTKMDDSLHRIENDLPIWNSTFDPQANGARLLRNNYVVIDNQEEPETEVQAPVDNTVPGGNPNNYQQNLGGQNPPQGNNANGYQPQQGNGQQGQTYQNPPQGGNGNGYQPQQGNGGQQIASF